MLICFLAETESDALFSSMNSSVGAVSSFCSCGTELYFSLTCNSFVYPPHPAVHWSVRSGVAALSALAFETKPHRLQWHSYQTCTTCCSSMLLLFFRFFMPVVQYYWTTGYKNIACRYNSTSRRSIDTIDLMDRIGCTPNLRKTHSNNN